MNVLLVTSPGMYATVRAESGSWTVPWGAVLVGTSPTVMSSPPDVQQVACARVQPSDLTYVLARIGTRGPVAFSVRAADTQWSVLENLRTAARLLDDIDDVCCGATDNDTVHVIASSRLSQTAVGLVHTSRTGQGAWTEWIDIPDPRNRLGGTVQREVFAAAGIGNELHVVTQWSPNGEQTESVEHSIRFADGTWQRWMVVPTPPFSGPVSRVRIACVGVGSDLYVFLKHEKMYYAVRNANGHWSPWVEMAAGAPASGFDAPLAAAFAPASDGDILHVYAGGFHIMRHCDRWFSWQDTRPILGTTNWHTAGMAAVSRVL